MIFKGAHMKWATKIQDPFTLLMNIWSNQDTDRFITFMLNNSCITILTFLLDFLFWTVFCEVTVFVTLKALLIFGFVFGSWLILLLIIYFFNQIFHVFSTFIRSIIKASLLFWQLPSIKGILDFIQCKDLPPIH